MLILPHKNEIMYHKNLIDKYLSDWKVDPARKPLLLRGARQVGKSSAVRQLATQFEHFVEINFEETYLSWRVGCCP